ncbi:hypothetical protein D3C86_2131260 [compost metagenome]
MDVVSGLDPRLFGERGQGVVGDVAVPVRDVDDFVGVAGCRQRRQHDHQRNIVDAHVQSPGC